MSVSKVVPVAIASGTTDVDPDTTKELLGPLRLYGWWFQESAGTPAAAEVILRDGVDDTGEIIVRLEFTANENKEPFMVPFEDGIRINKGVYVDRVSGETQGTVFIG